MTDLPNFIIVYRSSSHYEVMSLNSNATVYVSLAECKSQSNADYLVRALNEYISVKKVS